MPFRPPNPTQDAISALAALVRESIQGRRQNQNIFGNIPTPTYEELRAKELKMLEKVATTTPDWKLGGPTAPDSNDPSKRIPRNLIIKELSGNFEEIELQFVPGVLDYVPDSNFIAIASMGRNNPHYHFAGSEDTLKFDIDWHSYQENREDVILKCKHLEALSKNDAYKGPPRRVKLIWNSLMYSDAIWQVVAAPYKLSLFQAHRNMLPQQAYQSITLKKVTDKNMSYDDIRKITT